MNELVPFEYQGLKAREAVWTDPRSVRFPRSEIGRIFRAVAGVTPATRKDRNVVETLVKRNPDLKALGVAVMVTATDRKQYRTWVYDFREIYTLAIHSDLPGARAYLVKFPALLEAEIRGRMFRPNVPLAAQYVDRILALPKGDPERLVIKREAIAAFEVHRATVDAWILKAIAGGVPGVRRAPKREYFLGVPEETKALAMKLVRELRGARLVDIRKVLDGKVSKNQLSRYRLHLQQAA